MAQPKLSRHREQKGTPKEVVSLVLFNPQFDGATEVDETGQVNRVQGSQGRANCVKKFTFYVEGNGGPG